MKESATDRTAEDLRRAGQCTKRAVRRAALLEDFSAVDQIVSEGWVAAKIACGVFETTIENESPEGCRSLHPLTSRWRALSAILGRPDPAAELPANARPN